MKKKERKTFQEWNRFNYFLFFFSKLFAGLRNLDTLMMNSNGLNIIHRLSPFHACSKLKSLFLWNNNVSNICQDWRENPNLVYLGLLDNQLQVLKVSVES